MARHLAILLSILVLASPAALSANDQKSELEFFEKKIRPVLVTKCYQCHSTKAKDPKGNLLLDTREGIRRGGESGHGVVPGNLDESTIIEALRYEGLEMPPKEQLPRSVIADFEEWVRMGAPDPREGKSAPIRRKIDFKRAREFWAFQPIKTGSRVSVRDDTWPRTKIDRFVLKSLEAKGIQPVPDADSTRLARRIWFDLVGLPPTPEEVANFVHAAKQDHNAAVEEVVDRLLDSPRFGERWGRHWLDVVRYAESTGMERNYTFPHAWRYRDYVIGAFNEDKPFDRFLTEQIAGDLLPHDGTADRNQNFIATGMLAMGPKSLNERNREQFLMDVVDDQIDVTSRAFLGLTVSCARCHDHKFDPVPTSEYYALAGIFRSTDTYFGTSKQNGNRQAGQLLALTANDISTVGVAGKGRRKKKGNNAKAVKQLQNARKRLKLQRAQLENAKNKKAKNAAQKRLRNTQKQLQRLQAQVGSAKQPNNGRSADNVKKQANAKLIMAVRDSSKISDTAIRERGEPNDRGEVIPRGFLTIATPIDSSSSVETQQSGRLEYAQWLTSPNNPLTARVAVNRVWQHLFGRGIVRTVNNFGANGDRPSHPELLDHLAGQFVGDNWSVKSLIRRIVTSRTYQLSARDNENAHKVDPDNRLLWCSNHRRLEVEAIRDAILAASGQLDVVPAEQSAVAKVGDGDVGRNLQTARFNVESRKRSVFLPIVRGAVPEILRVFDFPEPSIVAGQRDITTVPTQALYMMNSKFVIEQSLHMARRIRGLETDGNSRADLAYQLTLGRRSTTEEIARTVRFVDKTQRSFGDIDTEEANTRAWAGFCQSLFASAEFRYVE